MPGQVGVPNVMRKIMDLSMALMFWPQADSYRCFAMRNQRQAVPAER